MDLAGCKRLLQGSCHSLTMACCRKDEFRNSTSRAQNRLSAVSSFGRLVPIRADEISKSSGFFTPPCSSYVARIGILTLEMLLPNVTIAIPRTSGCCRPGCNRACMASAPCMGSLAGRGIDIASLDAGTGSMCTPASRPIGSTRPPHSRRRTRSLTAMPRPQREVCLPALKMHGNRCASPFMRMNTMLGALTALLVRRAVSAAEQALSERASSAAGALTGSGDSVSKPLSQLLSNIQQQVTALQHQVRQ